MLEIKKSYLMVMSVKVEPMTLAEFNSTRACFNAEINNNSSEVGYSVTCNNNAHFLSKEEFNKYCHEISNMKFSSAVEWMKLGFKATRSNWVNGCYIALLSDGLHLVYNNNHDYYPSLSDLEAADWQMIIE